MTYKILTVEDEPSIRKALAMGLAPYGFDVDPAPNGAAALAMAGATRYDSMLVDLRLPDIDGFEVIRKIKTIQPELVPVVITGSASMESGIEAIHLEVVGCIRKPFSMAVVIDTLQQAVAKLRLPCEAQPAPEESSAAPCKQECGHRCR